MNYYFIYLLISEDNKRTYVGFTNDLNNRLLKHRNGGVRTTKKFGNFDWMILEKILPDDRLARIAEKYWKSVSGRRKIKEIFKNKHN
jgi:putative endonuclease